MTGQRLHLILVGVICLLFVGLIGGAYGVNSMLSKEAGKLAAQKAKSQALAQEQVGLKAAQKSIAQYSELEKIAGAVVPEDKNQAEAVRQIANIAAANSISLSSITFPASSLGTSSGSGTAPVSPTSTGSRLSQLQPVKNIAGVYQLVITVTSDNSAPVQYDKFISFLSALEHNRRTAQVSTITLSPNAKNPDLLSFTLSLNEYIKP
jgi:hypothetical protein